MLQHPARVAAAQPEISPATRRPLKPGQRNPTPFDTPGPDEQLGHFPHGAQWEITEERAQHWTSHNFSGRRGDTNRFRCLGDLSSDEFALLLWDLDCWAGLHRRGRKVAPIADYLRPGREHWGAIATLLRELAALYVDA